MKSVCLSNESVGRLMIMAGKEVEFCQYRVNVSLRREQNHYYRGGDIPFFHLSAESCPGDTVSGSLGGQVTQVESRITGLGS